ncbi:MAG: cupin domain-containing protein [Rhodobacter sp.]|nr:cupin domain-containing protein [Rhodobacter sp.]
MDIHRAGSRPSGVGPDSYFTGHVRTDPIIQAPEPARVRALTVTFDPGARTAWHTHPLGQTLVVIAGRGLAQTEGEAIRDLLPGDTVWIPPHEKHWHGAGPENGMTHIAIQEALDGSNVTWMEHVTDAQYSGKT